MALPFPVLATSQIQKRKKVVLLGLFALGLFITIIQIIRIQTVQRLANYTDSAPLIMWSTVENNLGIIVACIPTLAPLVKYYAEQRSTRAAGGSGGDGSKQRNVGSRYAMQSWKGRTLDSRHDEGSSFEGHVAAKREQDSERGGHGSTDSILDAGIRKKVEINVTRA